MLKGARAPQYPYCEQSGVSDWSLQRLRHLGVRAGGSLPAEGLQAPGQRQILSLVFRTRLAKSTVHMELRHLRSEETGGSSRLTGVSTEAPLGGAGSGDVSLGRLLLRRPPQVFLHGGGSGAVRVPVRNGSSCTQRAVTGALHCYTAVFLLMLISIYCY